MLMELRTNQIMFLQKKETYDRAIEELNEFHSKVSEITTRLESEECLDELKTVVAKTGEVVKAIDYELS